LEYLHASDNPKITNVNYIINLKTLYACRNDCGINDNGIKKLINLEFLDTSYNSNMTIKLKNQYNK